MSKFYISTTLPYVNAAPHIGFAAEIIRADVWARWHRQIGHDVFFNTGTDEHGLKIFKKAEEKGIDPQVYCDEYAAKFKDLRDALNLSYDNFIRTTDKHHMAAAQEFWRRCTANGDIYKKNYKVKYCVGCELEKTDSELVNGECPLHPGKPLEIIEEENYFFRFKNYQEKLLKFYEANKDFVISHAKFHEIENFVRSGLEDFSISRLKSKMPWGVPVPGDDEQVMYVWFDALINYISVLGWPEETAKFKEFWPGIQVCGKDNLRQQTAMWQAMLMSAGVSNSKQVFVFGFITSNGQKMSKSLGNTVNPLELVAKYGTDATRYYLLAELPPFEDGDFTYEKFELKYNADLANGLGNLVGRVSNLLDKNEIQVEFSEVKTQSDLFIFLSSQIDSFQYDRALKALWDILRECDQALTEKTPWKMKDKNEIKDVLEPIAQRIYNVVWYLQPFLPETSEKIIKQFSEKQIKKGEGLFPRLENATRAE